MTIGPQAPSKITALTNVEAGCLRPDGTYCSISWEDRLGFRYHFWTNIPVGEAPETLYKNCQLSINHGDPGYFNARYLNPNTARNAAMIAEALAVVERDGLIAKLIENERQKELAEAEAEAAAAKETKRIATIQAAGVDLYEALKAAGAYIDGRTSIRYSDPLRVQIRHAIAKAEGGAS
jgi:hypothetical protein